MRSGITVRRVGAVLLRVLGAFVILEPLWMLLPFAGFLYGSVLNIETLSRSPLTAWTTHFVFPVLTLGPVGPALVLVGLGVFVVGAIQIYTAKLRKTGLVTTGIYRFVRHPQYVSLTLFGLGVLLTWGRAIAYVAFFAMMLLYYHLTRHEEARCRELFGEEYEQYRERTSFLFPGDRRLFAMLRPPRSPWLHFAVSVLVAAVLCAGSMWLVVTVKRARRAVPFLEAEVDLGGGADRAARDLEAGTAAGLPYVTDGRIAVFRGPYRAAAAPGFAERVLLRVRDSERLAPHLRFLDEASGECAVIYGLPWDRKAVAPEDRGERGPSADPWGPHRATLLVFRCSGPVEAAVAGEDGAGLSRGFFAQVDLEAGAGEDIASGEVFVPGPGFPVAQRWRFVRGQIREQIATGGPVGEAILVPGAESSLRLLLVEAPIYRTRHEPAFAEEILVRLTASNRFVGHLRASGAGGPVRALAFPRPGPNWYREHHGTPIISVFVMLARPRDEDASPARLFVPEGRDLLGAFIADLDFAVAPPGDPVTGIRTVGIRRDLEERFAFFLSGL